MRGRSGQALVEYVLLVTLVALLLIGALLYFSGTLGNTYAGTVDDMKECVRPGEGGVNPGKDDGDPPGLCDKK